MWALSPKIQKGRYHTLKLNVKRTFFVGLAFMVISVFWGFYDQAIAYILKYEFHLEEIVTNSIMAIDNVLALFMLPLFGMLSDKTDTKLGKRTPYILFGSMASALFLLGMGFGVQLHLFWLFFAMLFLTLVAMATFRSPAVALMPDVTPRANRSKANAIINIMGGVGSAIAMAAIMFLVKKSDAVDADGGHPVLEGQNYWPVILTIAVVMVVGIVVFMLTVKEKKLQKELFATGEMTEEDLVDEEEQEASATRGIKLPRPVLKSLLLLLSSVAFWYIAYNGITTNLSRYFQEIMGKGISESSVYSLITLVVTGVAMVPLLFISTKLGRKKTILLGVCLMISAYGAGSFINSNTNEIFCYGIFAVIGIGWAAINVNSYPMVVEMSRSGDVGKYTGYYYTFSMAAQVATPLLTGLLVSDSLLDLPFTVLFPYAMFFMVLALVCMIFVKHGESPDIVAKRQAKKG